jgi:hypothetical protein
MTPTSAAAEPVRVPPSTKWILDYAINSCKLSRGFGEGPRQIVLSFESEGPGSMDMLVIGRGLDTMKDEVSASFLPSGVVLEHGRPAVASNDSRTAVLWGGARLLPKPLDERVEARDKAASTVPRTRPQPIPKAQQDEEKAARQAFAAATTEIRIDSRRPVILETGSLGEAIKSLDDCARESLRDWGVDPDLEDRIARPVWALDSRKWISPNDYPGEMLRGGHESQVNARVLVDAAGHVTKCTSLSRYEQKEFNTVTCNLITQRAKFAPAELADGTKVASYYNVRVRFQIGH